MEQLRTQLLEANKKAASQEAAAGGPGEDAPRRVSKSSFAPAVAGGSGAGGNTSARKLLSKRQGLV